MFKYANWSEAYNENQTDYANGTYETEVFTGKTDDFSTMVFNYNVYNVAKDNTNIPMRIHGKQKEKSKNGTN